MKTTAINSYTFTGYALPSGAGTTVGWMVFLVVLGF